jgi:Fe-S-cluster-containing hydrogenase component 2
MGMRILIDMTGLRNPRNKAKWEIDGYYLAANQVLKNIREIAAFKYACRKCEDAPCINACPKDALEKDEEGVVQRALNMCISCKSCVVICPFGTLMNDFFAHTINKVYAELSDEAGIQQLLNSAPPGVVRKVKTGEEVGENIVEFNEHILIKDYVWK